LEEQRSPASPRPHGPHSSDRDVQGKRPFSFWGLRFLVLLDERGAAVSLPAQSLRSPVMAWLVMRSLLLLPRPDCLRPGRGSGFG
jgi:hypothetical protein